ncbi:MULTISPECIES: hypothetical protein [unclassified Nodularia (in: cyanobacteria)]|uniref:hypothetical protein n=1 Tax=unclassified Nodularia (in: cyanobacteria) TaxID=2656917 RepID=UPI00187FDAAF|nr:MULTISPECIES: hypothetical protein [unclassified Nodularia (in: cyanobacteria)]MBE9199320.1 hypothetical protein [Nodularia sp. LEGE 06071]MCC2693662.1 hypothetical protein [Nodularia sp. LEGE 04288]
MYKNKPNTEELLSYIETGIEDYNQQLHADFEASNELLSTINMEFVERRELGTDEEYSQQLDAELEAK